MKSIIKKVGFGLLVLLLGFITLKWDEISLSYHGSQMLKPENRLKYFQDGQEYALTRLINKSSKPYHLKQSDTLITLPDTFMSLDSVISVDDFLENLRYEGLLVMSRGEIVYEEYWNGLEESETHILNSITKSIISIVVGIAIDEGLIGSKEDIVTKYLPDFKGTWYDNVTIDDCLDMVSGVKWERDIPMMLEFAFRWGWNLTSPENHLLNLDSWFEPGEQMVYNSMDPLIVGLVLESVIGDRTISEYINEKLWEPIGAEDDAFFNYLNEDDIETTWAGMHATMRDLAKIGLLFLEKGNWNGNQIVSETWVNQSFISHRETTKPKIDHSLGWKYDTHGWGYNNYWWIPDDTNNDEIFGFGLGGQTLYINRSNKLAIVSFRANPLNLKNVNPDFLDRSMLDFMQAISSILK